MKTAMQELRDKIVNEIFGDHIQGEVFFSKEQVLEFIDEQIPTESQQIINAYIRGKRDGTMYNNINTGTGEDYYNKNYKQ